MPQPHDLTCEYQHEPIGLDAVRPRLGWIIPVQRRGLYQRAYHVLVASSPHMLDGDRGDLWDSGKVSEQRNYGIRYTGRRLASGQRAYWKVRIWDEEDSPGPWSEPASWEMGLLHRDDWRARWIVPVNSAGATLAASLIRCDFKIDQPIRSARLHATARGIYVPWLNGRRIGLDHFRPGWTDYRKRIPYQTYDLTDSIRQGPNALGFMLGEGWYCGELGWGSPLGRQHYGQHPELLAQIVLTLADGSERVIATDESWLCGEGGVITGGFLSGEAFDARREPRDWCEPGFDHHSWVRVRSKPIGEANLVAQQAPPVRATRAITPISITQGEGGTWIADMGQNMVGWIRLKVRGEAGRTVILRHAEMLDDRGRLYTENLRRARATDQYTLAGDEVGEAWEPRFTFHGFRYVEISGYPGKPEPADLTGIVIHSDLPLIGEFECDHPMINQLQHNILWGQRGNFLEVPTDCPQRDERLGWMGDIQVFAPTACFNMQALTFLEKWMRDVVDAQSAQGAFPNVAPRVVIPADGAPAWGDAGIIVPWTLYRSYGDPAVLEEHFDAMAQWVHYLHDHNPDLIWTNKRGPDFGEWLSIRADTPKEVLATAYFAHSTDLLARIADLLGRARQSQYFRKLFQRIRTAFIERFVGDDGTVHGRTQACYLLALRFGLMPEEMRRLAVEHLVRDIRDRDDHLSTGFIGVSFLLPVLTEHGHFDLAAKLLLNETFPSWGFSIRHGATTIWERWDGWTPDNGFQTPGMNSFNHYCFGSVGEWIYRTLGGIDLDESRPTGEKLIIAPRPIPPVDGRAGITRAKASLRSFYGPIAVNWAWEDPRWWLEAEIPANLSAVVRMPAKGVEQVTESDSPLAEAGLESRTAPNGWLEVLVGPGVYRFTVENPNLG
ncbi:MAG: family 78 glycoside hydrolase catalytic domain [Phycisphaeraceae bacterium]|nr:family 78 glycoside hydrolase catalytic domain [Phycisphaeraceae bacterium]